MKVLAVFLFVVATVAARGSGPYLPSGWRPTGPAFFLPSEVQKPAGNPLQDVILEGSEASGSEALREYGPPKLQELPLGVTNQGLPDVAIEQNFVVSAPSLEAVARLIVDEQAVDNSVKSDEAVTVQLLEAFTESQRAEEQTVSAVTSNDEVQAIVEERGFSNGEKAIEAEEEVTQTVVTLPSENSFAEVTLIENVNEQTTVSNEELVSGVNFAEQDSTVSSQQVSVSNNEGQAVLLVSEQQTTTDSVVNAEIALSELSNIDTRIEAVQQIVEIEGKVLENIVQNIPEIIASLDSEVQSNQVKAVQVPSVPENAGSLEQAPEGFLEYGPPGFSEYGPPKEDQLTREAAVGKSLELESINSNEARRRRFSPKFKPTRKAH